jgi:hypothetical protein
VTALALLVLVLGAAARAEVVLEAELAPSLVVPPPGAVRPDTRGSATLVLADDGVVRWQLRVAGLTGFATATEVRHGGTGENGPVVAALTNPPASGDHVGHLGPLDAATQEALFDGSLYVSVATAVHPAGELRGQIRVARLEGTTCSCAAGSPALRACVRRALRALSPRARRSSAMRRLRRAVRHAACGPAPSRIPPNSGACCLPHAPDRNLVVGRLCSQVAVRRCARLGGVEVGVDCFTGGGPCRPRVE